MTRYLFFLSSVLFWGSLLSANAQVVDTIMVMDSVTIGVESEKDGVGAYEEDYSNDDYGDDEIRSVKKGGLTEPIVRYFPADSIQSLRKQKDYLYMAKLDSLLRHYKEEVPEQEALPSVSLFDGTIIRFILWTIALLAVLYLLFQVFAGKQNLFARNKKLQTASQAEEVSNLPALSPIQLAQQAAAAGDYRKAVRYQFLYILQLLAERKKIILLPQKTNEQYLAELKDAEQQQQFSKLILQYEYIWYGHFALNQSQYQTIEDGFRNFTSKWL